MSYNPDSRRSSSSDVLVIGRPFGDAFKLATKSQAEPTEIGMTVGTRDLYRKNDYSPWREWDEAKIATHAGRSPESAKFALVVRRETRTGDTEDECLALHSIRVQSPLIKEQLDSVFSNYQGVNMKLQKLELTAPFHPFFFRWAEFVQAKPEARDEVALCHYNLLFDVISPEIEPHISHAADLLDNGVISFDYVWALFEPGAEIYSRVDENDRLFILDEATYQTIENRSVMELRCRYVDMDGDAFGYREKFIDIPYFQGLRPVHELNACPSRLLPDIDEMRTRLEARGRKLATLQGIHHKAYTGPYRLSRPPHGASDQQQMSDGRVIVDCGGFQKFDKGGDEDLLVRPDEPAHRLTTNGNRPNEPRRNEGVVRPVRPVRPLGRGQPRCYPRHPDLYGPSHRPKDFTFEVLKDDQFRLCTPEVRGYDLRAKAWAYLDIDLIHEIPWNVNAFDRLVLPQDYKSVIWAFVEGQLGRIDDFDDVIKDKGKGIIMLLRGSPGTGKTLTSESVSEAMQKPLYSMGAGELGDHIEDVEINLGRVLELSTRWNAILLLDECDVFLEKRTEASLETNQLVAVFLRLLEYYDGVMFLTTNRSSSLDPAFDSRIHLTVDFPELGLDSRQHIWETFIRSSDCKITDVELHDLAGKQLNGRQIKNIVKAARLLAARDRAPLSLAHVNTVLRLRNGNVGLGMDRSGQ